MLETKKIIKNEMGCLQNVTMAKCESTIDELKTAFNASQLKKIKIDLSSSKKALHLVTAWNVKKAFVDSVNDDIRNVLSYGESMGFSTVSETYIENMQYLSDIKKIANNNLKQELKPLTSVLDSKGAYSFKTCMLDNNYTQFKALFLQVFELEISKNDFSTIQDMLSSLNTSNEFVLNNFNTLFMRLVSALLVKSNGLSSKKMQGCLNKAMRDIPYISDKEFYSGIGTLTRERLTPYITLKDDEKENASIINDKIKKQVGKKIVKLLPDNIKNFTQEKNLNENK